MQARDDHRQACAKATLDPWQGLMQAKPCVQQQELRHDRLPLPWRSEPLGSGCTGRTTTFALPDRSAHRRCSTTPLPHSGSTHAGSKWWRPLSSRRKACVGKRTGVRPSSRRIPALECLTTMPPASWPRQSPNELCGANGSLGHRWFRASLLTIGRFCLVCQAHNPYLRKCHLPPWMSKAVQWLRLFSAAAGESAVKKCRLLPLYRQ